MGKKELYQKNYPNLEAVLKGGAVLKIFSSGGRLRVIRVEKEGQLAGYSESPNLSGALLHCEIDLQEGHLSYEAQYSGKNAKYLHYLTGEYPEDKDNLDIYIFSGGNLRVLYHREIGFLCKEENLVGIYGCHETLLGAIKNFVDYYNAKGISIKKAGGNLSLGFFLFYSY